MPGVDGEGKASSPAGCAPGRRRSQAGEGGIGGGDGAGLSPAAGGGPDPRPPLAAAAEASVAEDAVREGGKRPPKLKVENLGARAGGKPILKNINLSVERGEILAIIGPAGAGKTTFLRALNRMSDLDPGIEVSGQAYLDGSPIRHESADPAIVRRRLGMVFSVPVPLPLSVRRNVSFGVELDASFRGSVGERVEMALRAAYLWDEVKDRLDEPASNLSGGQQQRLCLARTIALKPDVLLLDEPCSGLDPISTAKIEDALQDLKEEMAVILVTNNVKQASRASDRTAFFFFGELVELNETRKLFTAPQDGRTADYISGRFG